MKTTIEKARKYDYADVIIWLGLAIIVLWMIAKIIGLIP
ncbi:hypothetical protein METP1_00620 [Methanosarcinales archaeon]|nr:hypothetical protein METP1_00620 [Methanosarcinales archaeon]